MVIGNMKNIKIKLSRKNMKKILKKLILIFLIVIAILIITIFGIDKEED